jgi:chemotaxis response regulator CheB
MDLILIVTDIGGPPALHDLLSQLSRDFGVPIVVLQSFDVGVLETSAAVLRRTVQLEVSILDKGSKLIGGKVYFARPEIAYNLAVVDGQLEVKPAASAVTEPQHGVLVQTIVGMAKLCRERLTAVFLSGRGRGEELATSCKELQEAGAEILVLDRLETVVSDMGRQVMKHAATAREVGIGQLVEYLAIRDSGVKQPQRRTGLTR